MPRLAVLTIFFALLWLPAWANFGEGQARFSSGDYEGAFEAWRPLAEEGDPRAQYSLGLLYDQGLGVEQDLEQAKLWYQRAAEQDYTPAAAALRAVLARIAPPRPAVTAPAPSRAGATPPAPPRPLTEREQIEALVHNLLRQADLQLRAGRLGYDKVAVTEVADGFEVDVYGIVLQNNDGKRMDVGEVGARITRQGDRYYNIGFVMPATMYGHEPGDNKPFEIRIGQQSNTMLWDRDLEILVDIGLDWRDLAVVDPTGRENARIAGIAVRSDMVNDGKRWSGPIVLAIEGVEVTDGNQDSFSLGKFSFRTIVDRLDMVRYAALSRAVVQGQQTPKQTIGALEQLLAGIAVEFAIEDLAVERPKAEPIRLQSANYRLGLNGLDQKLASLDMSYGHGGLKGSPPDIPELAPREARVRLVFDRLPIATLLETGVAAVLEYMFFGQVGAQGDVLNQLRLALSSARTEFRIEDGLFQAPKLAVGIAGLLSADAQAVWGLAGDISVSIFGLDTLIEAYESNASKRPKGAPPSVLPTLMKQLGQVSEDGRTHVYNFRVTREGQVLVNGENAMPLIMAFFSG